MEAPLSTATLVALTAGAFGAGFFLGERYWRTRPLGCLKRSRSKSENGENAPEEESDLDSDAEYESSGEPHKMIMVVRMDLKMGKGKIAAQCCHAAVGCYRHARPEALRAWFSHGQAKVAVKCKTEEEMMQVAAHAKALGLNHYVVLFFFSRIDRAKYIYILYAREVFFPKI